MTRHALDKAVVLWLWLCKESLLPCCGNVKLHHLLLDHVYTHTSIILVQPCCFNKALCSIAWAHGVLQELESLGAEVNGLSWSTWPAHSSSASTPNHVAMMKNPTDDRP